MQASAIYDVRHREPTPGTRGVVVRRVAPAADFASRYVESRYGIRVPGAPYRIEIVHRPTGDVVASYRLHSTDGVEARLHADLASLDEDAFAAIWCDRTPESPTPAPTPLPTRSPKLIRRLRTDVGLAAAIVALTAWPVVRLLRNRRRTLR